MDERRTILRIAYHAPIQYLPSQDLLPHGGRLVDISERGAGVVVSEPYRFGEQLTISIPLPGEEEPLTVTGAVRWSAPQRRVGRRYAVGLEWFPLGETARHRLRTFLTDRLPEAMRRSLVYRTGMLIGLVGAVMTGWILLSVYRENRQLISSLEQRRAIIQQLEDQERQSLEEMTRLHREVRQLEGMTVASTDPAP